MKRKRYFCDWTDELIGGSKNTKLLLLINLSLVIIPIIGVICYNSIMFIHQNDIIDYIKTTYATYEEIDNKLTLSEEYEDVSNMQENKIKKIRYSSTETYMGYIKVLIILTSATLGMIIYILIVGALLISRQISKVHKNRDRRKNFHKRKR